MTPNERNVLITTCLGHFLSHFNMLVFPAVILPLTLRLGLPLDQVVGLSFWMYLLFGLTALPWGMVADRIGAKMLMGLYYGGAGFCALAAAVWMDAPVMLSFFLAGIGLFSGIYHPVGLGMISKLVRRVSMGMGINGMFGNLGLAMGPLMAGVVTWLWGPRATYGVLGVFNLFGLLVMAVLSFPVESHHETPLQRDNHTKGFGILLVAMMLAGIAYRGATVILPAYFELRNQALYEWLTQLLSAGLSANLVATVITSAIFFVGMLGQYFGGRIADRRSLPHSYFVFHFITLTPAFLMAWATDLPLVLLAFIYFFFLLGMQPIENTLVSKLTPSHWRHAAYGMKFVLTFGMGSLAVKGVEAVQKSAGILWVYPSLGCVSLVLVMTIGLLIVRTRTLTWHA